MQCGEGMTRNDGLLVVNRYETSGWSADAFVFEADYDQVSHKDSLKMTNTSLLKDNVCKISKFDSESESFVEVGCLCIEDRFNTQFLHRK